MYAHGYGVSQNYEKAFECYQMAAEKGFPEAQGNLGVLYSKGSGVIRDYGKAIAWLNKAANSGLVTAQTNLALLYDETNKKIWQISGIVSLRSKGIRLLSII